MSNFGIKNTAAVSHTLHTGRRGKRAAVCSFFFSQDIILTRTFRPETYIHYTLPKEKRLQT